MVRLPQTSMPLPCQIPVIVAKLMTAIQGLWYQLPVPDKGIFRGVSTRMNARVQHRNNLQKVISCLLVFCLAFYYVGVPTTAYATTADEGVVATDETVSPEQLSHNEMTDTDETGSPEQLSHFEDQNETDSSGQQSHPSEVADSTDTTDTTEGEGDRDLNEPDPDEPAEPKETEPQYSVSASSSFDAAERTITYTVNVTNTGASTIESLSFTSPGGVEDPTAIGSGVSIVENAGDDSASHTFDNLPADFSLGAGQTTSFTFEYEIGLDPAAGGSVNVAFTVFVYAGNHVESANCETDCVFPYSDFTVTGTSIARDARGYLLAEDEPAAIGDTLYFTYTVTNTGTLPLSGLSASIKSISSFEGAIELPSELQPGESQSFTVTHVVVDEDFADVTEDEPYAVVLALAIVEAGNLTHEFELSSPKMTREYYSYTIDFVARHLVGNPTYYPAWQISLRNIGPEMYLPFETIYDHCPEGYDISLYMMDEDENVYPVELQDAEPLTLPSLQSNIIVVYDQIPIEAAYTVNYYLDSTEGKHLGSDYGTGNVGDPIPVSATAPAGYKATPVITGPEVIGADATQNVVDVVYERDSFGYTVNYYSRDHAGQESFLGSTTGPAATYGSTVTVPVEQLNAKLPTGFKALEAGADYTVDITADEAQNVIDVTYEPDTFTYTIRYYHDAALDDAYHFQGEPLVGEAVYGSTVHVDIHTLNRNIPDEGFYPKDNDDEFDIVITEDAAANSYNVVYERASYGYTIAYYKDSVAPENLLGERTGVYLWDYNWNVYQDERNAFLPEGYKRFTTSDYVRITADESQNVLNVVYDQKRNDLGYTVNYYRDSVDAANLLGSDTGTGTFEDAIPYVSGKYAPEGYDATGVTSGATTIGVDADANVLNVVYSKGQVGYTVNYYRDSVDAANLLGSMTGSGVLGSDIPYEVGPFAPVGYDVANAATSGQTLVTADASANVLNVVYTKQNNLSWRVNYYLGSMDGAPVASETGYGAYGDAIIFEEGKHLAPGYTTPAQISGDTTIVNLEGESVLNVVYPLGSYDYTVNYYKDAISEDNLLGSDVADGLYGSPVIFEQGKYAPEGYLTAGQTNGALTVGYDVASNVLNIVYTVDSFGYSINYYKGSVADENLVETVHNPADLRPFGSTVELRVDEMNMHRPNGYAEVSNARNLTITADAASNVINVVFAPDFGEFYATGIEPVVTTYDGSTHYVTAPGVVDGDVVTYVCDGVYETRTVGVDENIGLEFTEVTDGDVPVVVMLTRAGIASNAVQTYVNIAPAPVVPDDPDTPDNPDNPVTPDNPDNPDDPDNPNDPANEDPEVPSDIYVPGADTTTTDRGPMGQIAERIFSYVDPGIDVPAPLNATPIESGLDLAGAETIADDANPLAAPAAPQKDFNAVSYLLVVLATLCLAATSILLVVGKHIGNRMMQMSVELAITDERKRRVVKRIATGLGVCAIVLYVLWATLLLL